MEVDEVREGGGEIGLEGVDVRNLALHRALGGAEGSREAGGANVTSSGVPVKAGLSESNDEHENGAVCARTRSLHDEKVHKPSLGTRWAQ